MVNRWAFQWAKGDAGNLCIGLLSRSEYQEGLRF